MMVYMERRNTMVSALFLTLLVLLQILTQVAPGMVENAVVTMPVVHQLEMAEHEKASTKRQGQKQIK